MAAPLAEFYSHPQHLGNNRHVTMGQLYGLKLEDGNHVGVTGMDIHQLFDEVQHAWAQAEASMGYQRDDTPFRAGASTDQSFVHMSLPGISCQRQDEHEPSCGASVPGSSGSGGPMSRTQSTSGIALVRSCRARRSASAGMRAEVLKAAWHHRTVRHSSPTPPAPFEHACNGKGSSDDVILSRSLDGSLPALWDEDEYLLPEDSILGMADLYDELQPSCHDASGSGAAHGAQCMPPMEPCGPALAGCAGSGCVQAASPDHIFMDCCLGVGLTIGDADAETGSDAVIKLSIFQQQQPLPLGEQDPAAYAVATGTPSECPLGMATAFAAAGTDPFGRSASSTSSEASFMFLPADRSASGSPRRSGTASGYASAAEQSSSPGKQSKRACLDLGLRSESGMAADLEAIPVLPANSAMTLDTQVVPLPAAAPVAAGPSTRQCVAPTSRSQRPPAPAADASSSQAKRPLPRRASTSTMRKAAAPKDKHISKLGCKQPISRQGSHAGAIKLSLSSSCPTSPLAAVQALFEWQALSHRVVSAASAPNQATAWDLLTDNELERFLAKMGKSNDLLASGSASRETLINSIKWVIVAARMGSSGSA